MRTRGKRDGNHAEIIAALRKAGMSAIDLGAVGGGCPDIAIGWRGVTALVEIKDGALTPGCRKLTADQEAFFASWGGLAFVATSPQNAIDQMTVAVEMRNKGGQVW